MVYLDKTQGPNEIQNTKMKRKRRKGAKRRVSKSSLKLGSLEDMFVLSLNLLPVAQIKDEHPFKVRVDATSQAKKEKKVKATKKADKRSKTNSKDVSNKTEDTKTTCRTSGSKITQHSNNEEQKRQCSTNTAKKNKRGNKTRKMKTPTEKNALPCSQISFLSVSQQREKREREVDQKEDSLETNVANKKKMQKPHRHKKKEPCSKMNRKQRQTFEDEEDHKKGRQLTAQFSMVHILPMQQLQNFEVPDTFENKKINHAGNFNLVSYQHIKPKIATMQKSLKHKSQKAFVTSSPVLAINTENQMELETGLFRVVGQVLPGFDKVEVHHLEGPLPTGFLQRAVSKGKG